VNCFVIMPFAPEFDDVYATIKASVEAACDSNPLRCFRLDESRPAGRITDRLLKELHSASICIADLTGESPNVMWEVGYAMALEKPTIIITQEKGELPFDIKGMETIRYERNHLSETLGRPLKNSTIDTLSLCLSASAMASTADPPMQAELLGELLAQIGELKSIVNQAVRTWNPTPEQRQLALTDHDDPRTLEGAWVNRESGTHIYARVIGDELVMPYSYGGNEMLTSAYYGWQKVGEFWFARFCWLSRDISGFTFLKRESVDLLTGAWWQGDESEQRPDLPNLGSGEPSRWERNIDAPCPEWALQFFEEIRRHGVTKWLSAQRSLLYARTAHDTD
jgi:hypothetical protein